MTLKINIGTVNYTDYIHVTAARVSNPGVIVWEDYINVPVANIYF